MNKKQTEQKNALSLFCPNLDCPARGQVNAGNIVTHGQKRVRYKCKTCNKTFSGHQGTMLEGLRKPEELIITVVTLLCYGCPIQAIVQAFHLDERTVARWYARAGKHCKMVHTDQIVQGKLDLMHVQADEIRVKGCRMIAWMGLAVMVSTRLFLGGVVSPTRDRDLTDTLLAMVKACCRPLCAILVCTDGFAAYANSIRRAFREKVARHGKPGRCRLQAWPEVLIGTVINHTKKKHVVEVVRRMTQGGLEAAEKLLSASKGGTVLNTAFIERLNGTFRQRMACLTRRCRHAARQIASLDAGMWLVGCTYNFCFPHHELSRRLAKTQGRGTDALITPAMASGLTDHIWSIRELLFYRIPPSAWIAPKKRKYKKKSLKPDIETNTRAKPLLRLRKGALCVTR